MVKMRRPQGSVNKICEAKMREIGEDENGRAEIGEQVTKKGRG